MDIKEYLKEAKAAVIELNDKEKELKALKNKEDSYRKSLSDLEKKQSDCIEKTIKDKKNEILKYYEGLYQQASKALREQEEVREKAKNEKLKVLVDQGTSGIKEECDKIKQELKDKMNENGIPFFVNTKLFCAMFMPSTFSDFVLFFIIFVGLVVGVPYYIFWRYKFREMIWFVAFIIAAIFIYGCLVLIVDHFIINKKRDAIKECMIIRKELHHAQKDMSKKADSIKKETTDEQLALDSYDYDINKIKEEMKKIIEEKDATLKNFEDVVKDQIKQEVILAAKKDFDEVEDKIVGVTNEITQITSEHDSLKKDTTEKYESELGKELMRERTLNTLIDKVNSSETEITTVEQAKALLK